MNLKSTQLLPGLVLLISSVVTNSANAAEPAWCNNDSLADTEKMICDDKTLSKADLLLDQMYRAVLSYRGLEGHEGMWPGEIISDQREFLEQRSTLATKSEILDLYTTRIKALTGMLKLRWQPQ